MKASRRPQVIDPDSLAELTARSNGAGLRQLAHHVLALIATGSLAIVVPGPAAMPAYLAYSVLLVFSFCPAHESIHRSAFRSEWLNRVVAFCCGLVLFLPPRYFDAYHMAHHRFTQIQGRDPELQWPKPNSALQYLWHISGIPYYVYQWRALCANAAGKLPGFVPARRRNSVAREARQFLMIYLLLGIGSLLLQSTLLWWVWLLPALIGQPFLRLFLLAEHTRCPEVADMFRNTRTTLTSRIMERLCWNMNYHTVHHAYVGVPFWQLPAAHDRVRHQVAVIDEGYVRVNLEIVRHLGSG